MDNRNGTPRRTTQPVEKAFRPRRRALGLGCLLLYSTRIASLRSPRSVMKAPGSFLAVGVVECGGSRTTASDLRQRKATAVGKSSFKHAGFRERGRTAFVLSSTESAGIEQAAAQMMRSQNFAVQWRLLRYAITKPLLGLGFSFIMFLSLSIGYIGYNPKPSNVIAIVDDKGNPLGPYLPVKDIVALEHLHLAAMHGAQSMPTVHVPKRVKIKIVRRKRTRRSHRSAPPIKKKTD
eukprot:jgi/Mesvir1/29466/Mv24151-RA.1